MFVQRKEGLMGRSVSSLIWEYVLPVMMEHNFTHIIDEEGDWWFSKKSADGEHTQTVIITLNLDSLNKDIQLSLRLHPSFKYQDMNLKGIIVGDEKLKRSPTGGWICSSLQEAKAIIQIIAKSMEINGFKALDAAQNDPNDIYPTSSEYEDLYKNHKKYAEEFRERHRLDSWDLEQTLDAIQEELDCFPSTITKENRKQLLTIAAACGEIFIERGGRWIWLENFRQARIEIPNRKRWSNEMVNSYLAVVYRAALTGKTDMVSRLIKSELNGTGNL